MTVNTLYFGCWSAAKPGHFLYRPDGSTVPQRDEDGPPFNHDVLDSQMLPRDPAQTEGRVYRNVLAGWSVVSFFDRSGDDRPGSNSSFLAPGNVATTDLLAAAREAFPAIFARFTFELVEHSPLLPRRATAPKA